MTSAQPPHLAAALRHRGYLLSWWPWRALAYVLTTVPIAGVLSVGLLVVGAPLLAAVNAVRQHDRPVSLPLALFLAVGTLVVVALAPLVSAAVAALERWRLGVVDGRPVPARPWSGLAARYTSADAWREAAYAALLGSVVPLAYWVYLLLVLVDLMLVASPWLAGDADQVIVVWSTVDTPAEAAPYAIVGVLLLPVLWYGLGVVAAAQAAMARRLLGSAGDTAALREVTRSRARLVDSYEAERRRIERDLHDAAQPRLTSLTLQLGLARLDVPEDSPRPGRSRWRTSRRRDSWSCSGRSCTASARRASPTSASPGRSGNWPARPPSPSPCTPTSTGPCPRPSRRPPGTRSRRP